MVNDSLENLRYWVEPAHPMVIKLRDDLVAIYRLVKDRFQKEIDAAFDRGSQQIGFVVTTTVPVTLELGEGGFIKSLGLGSDCLKGTALEKELLAVFERMIKGNIKTGASSGIYNIALFWYDAVNLKLRTDWMEPAHPAFRLQSELMGLRRSPQSARGMDMLTRPHPWLEPVHHGPWCRPWMEPAHPHMPWMEPAHPHMPWLEPVHHGPWYRPWMEPAHHHMPWLEPAHPVFQPSDLQKIQERRYEHTEPSQYLSRVHQMIIEKTVLVSAIDEVYPELKLGERLNQAQYAMTPTLPLPPPRAAWPGVREPAHMMAADPWLQGPTPYPWRPIMDEIARLLERYGPQPLPWRYHLLSEIADVLARYSYGMLNPQPLPPRVAAFPGVREPAHPMAAMQPDMSRQLLAELALILQRYGLQI